MPLTVGHVLVTTDLSPESESACAPARRLVAEDGRLTLLYVSDFESHLPGGALTPSESARKRLWEEVRTKAEAKLEDIRKRRLEGVAGAELEVIDGHGAAHAICAYAEEHAVDIIVISGAGSDAGPLHWLGSVAERVVRTAPCMVLITHRSTD